MVVVCLHEEHIQVADDLAEVGCESVSISNPKEGLGCLYHLCLPAWHPLVVRP